MCFTRHRVVRSVYVLHLAMKALRRPLTDGGRLRALAAMIFVWRPFRYSHSYARTRPNCMIAKRSGQAPP